MVSEKTEQSYQHYRNKLTSVLKHLRVYSHELTEHATVIYSRMELALEETVEEDPVRVHLKGIHESAKEVASLSERLRDLGKN
jgi:signal transduction histidine kinase